MIRSLLLALALLVSLPGCSPAAPAASPAADGDARQAVLAEVNAERERAGAPPLRLDPRLSSVAQEHAEELGRSGVLRLDFEPKQRMRERLERAGYQAAKWVESAIASTEAVPVMMRNWKGEERALFREVMGADVRELGIGVSRMDGAPLYVLIFAESRGQRFAGETAGLADVEAVRAAMLEQVNAERVEHGRGRVKRNGRLDLAAQRHAEDMLARGFFDHGSPEGKRPRDRAREAGYTPALVAENIAAGQTTVKEVVDGWMSSPGHRRNLLERGVDDLGVGLAIGKGRNGEQVIWVQLFGRER